MMWPLYSAAFPLCECPRCRPAREREAREAAAELARLARLTGQTDTDADSVATVNVQP